MASSLIHIAVANEINKTLHKDSSKLLIGTIAPDMGKMIDNSKVKSHFSTEDEVNIPNLDKFLDKYKENLNDDFVLGYYIHLFTDYLWFKYFLDEIHNKDVIKKLDGSIFKCNDNMFGIYLYNDYTNLNISIIENYDLDLKIFYNEIPSIDNIIEEIPVDKLYLIVNEAGKIIENSKERKEMIINMNHIDRFIKLSTDLILSNLKELKIYGK